MDWSTYLEAIRREGTALASAATALDAAVPSCPGWDVADLVEHTGTVHRHKELIVREGGPVDWPPPMDPPGADLVAWFREGVDSLVATLQSHPPEERAWTWHEPDQTVGFWYRRMAQETLVHRIDAELALGRVSHVDGPLAADGFDELVGVMMTGAQEWMSVQPGAATIELVAADTGDRWLLLETILSGTSPHSGTTYDALSGYEFVDTRAAAHAVVRGSAPDLLRFGWGRGPLDALAIDGEPAIAHRFRSTAAEVTQ